MIPHTVHVAAMPFPTLQGTQAAIASMLRALEGNAELVTYGRGLDGELPRVPIRRARSIGARDAFRSGPSLQKLAEDAALLAPVAGIRGIVVAHHAEAAAVCLGTRRRPLVYFAHTHLGAELPAYFSRRVERAAAIAGGAVDRIACRGAQAVAAVSPLLASMLARSTGARVDHVPIPWPLQHVPSPEERAAARRALAIEGPALLYAGNLDAYQGLDALIGAAAGLSSEHRDLAWIVLSASPPEEILAPARAAGIADRIRFVAAHGESERRLAHAAADVAVVPRRIPGGVPIKLLDAAARGVPTIATRRACAGLAIDGVQVADDSRDALEAQLRIEIRDRDRARSDAELARRSVAAQFSDEAFKAALGRVIDRATRAPA